MEVILILALIALGLVAIFGLAGFLLFAIVTYILRLFRV